MAYLVDFLHLYGIEVDRTKYKMHLATGDEYPPLDAYYNGSFKEWQENQAQKNFECNHVIGLIALGGNEWLFAGVWKVLGREQQNGRWIYQTELLPNQSDLYGRLIVNHQRGGRAAYRWGSETGEEYTVGQLLKEKLTIEQFPGFHATSLPFSKLDAIVKSEYSSWKSALAMVQGIYLITDRSNGKKYVGKATGQEGVWGRWSSYVYSGHGGNRELIALLESQGENHKFEFTFTLLEFFDTHASESYIDHRESYWKQALASRSHGYNAN